MMDSSTQRLINQIISSSSGDDLSSTTSLICPYCDHHISSSEIFDEAADREGVREVNCFNCNLMFYGSQRITYTNHSRSAMTKQEAIADVLSRQRATDLGHLVP